MGALAFCGNTPFAPIKDAGLVRWIGSVSESPAFVLWGGLGPAELVLVDRPRVVLYGCLGEFRLALRNMFPVPLDMACCD